MIAIVNYGMGNPGSFRNMFSRIGVESIITSEHDLIANASKLILPGVGAFDSAINNLRQRGLIDLLNELVIERKVPILGVCLGFQLFAKNSEEGQLPGLGWINARTMRFQFKGENMRLRIPHMGWNTIEVHRSSPILDDRYENSRFYFVHSYHVECLDLENVLSTANYGIEFHAAAIKANIMGVQFHPEKSHKYGLRLLRNFAEIQT